VNICTNGMGNGIKRKEMNDCYRLWNVMLVRPAELLLLGVKRSI